MSTISASTTTTTAYKVTADTTGTLVLQTGATPTTAVTIGTNQVATFAQAPVLPSASIPQAALAAGVAGNGPLFSVYKNAGQSFSSVTLTKVTFQSEEVDTNNNFDTSTSRFTPTVAGYYQFNLELDVYSITSLVFCSLFKNGTEVKRGVGNNAANSETYTGCYAFIYLNGSTDYVEAYVYGNGGAPSIANDGVKLSYFQGFLARAA